MDPDPCQHVTDPVHCNVMLKPRMVQLKDLFTGGRRPASEEELLAADSTWPVMQNIKLINRAYQQKKKKIRIPRKTDLL